MQDVLSLILGGGRGAGLYPLTKTRSEPAVPIAGKYRLIDIPVSNCINSGLTRVYVLTQYLSVSLHRHIANTYEFDPFSQGFVEVLAAQQTNESADWYRGTADAVRQNIRYVHEDACRDVLILSGDQIYRMDFAQFLKTHRTTRADVTLAVVPVTAEQASQVGVARLDGSGRIVAFAEKPTTEEQLRQVRTDRGWLERWGVPEERPYLANMGIYLFHREALFESLNTSPLALCLATEVVPRGLRSLHVQAHLCDGFWADLGTIKAYHEVHLALAGDAPPFDFHSAEGVIYTHMRNLPAARVTAAEVRHSLLTDGCTIGRGTRLERSVVGVRSQIGRNVTLREAILLGANYYEGQDGSPPSQGSGVPALGVGDDSILERVIVDKNCRIGRGVRIVNERRLQEATGDNYVIRDGIVVLPNGAIVPDGTVI
ncbi:MAG TPA: glucose-1-phosphate adenylyltransferase [Gemmataceae bacterium]|nr:glucose-1-phosphate adenylyltransferase [Gemmataceae bacterium]